LNLATVTPDRNGVPDHEGTRLSVTNYNTTLSSDSLETGTGSSNSLRSAIQSFSFRTSRRIDRTVGFNYDNANRRTCLTLHNNVLVSYAYDTDSRVTSIGYGTGGSCSSPPTNLGNLTYSYDADGRRT
jgi:hypothetical protein